MASVLVPDTSVIVDLERGRFLPALFKLEAAFAVPDLLYEQELREPSGETLIDLGLQIAHLDGKGVALAQSCARTVKSISLPDAFAFALAKQGGHTLLVGDNALRTFSESQVVTCHGVRWVLDQLETAKLQTPKQLHDGLTAIAGHRRCRLPRTLVDERLKRYRK